MTLYDPDRRRNFEKCKSTLDKFKFFWKIFKKCNFYKFSTKKDSSHILYRYISIYTGILHF